jgi:hypothetical protein
VSPDRHDDVRAAAALLATAACGSRRLQAVVLDADPDQDCCAGIAMILADWLAQVLRRTGDDPREFARQVIAESIGAEAAEGAA